tara:strand:- start:5288 stop:5743 length:456 start_codon:yes stop_codon:yes gene_type:complete
MKCDMCSATGKLYKTIVEGAELSLCHECSKFGKVVGIIEQKTDNIPATVGIKQPQEEIIEIVVDDYAEKIRKKRESSGLNQKEFARKINEKESIVQKMESGHFEPSLQLAKKIGNLLKIRLTEEHKEEHEKQERSKTGSLTIGDLIKIKKK